MEPKIVFEDEVMVVVDKPAGMVVNRAATVRGMTVQEWVQKRRAGGEKEVEAKTGSSDAEREFYEKGGVVHRLDKDTSGVLVVAKNPEAYAALKRQFMERTVEKTYLALVRGRMAEGEGIITSAIERDTKNRMRFRVGGPASRAAITLWKVVKEYKKEGEEYSLLEVSPRTGRTHQIRVHLRHGGHGVVGDPLYAGRKMWRREARWCKRLFLHAQRLELTHPVTGEKRVFEADLPEVLVEVVAGMEEIEN